MSTHEGSDYQEYANASNQARNETRKALRDYEKDIAKSIKINPNFLRDVTSKLKNTGEVPHLKRNYGSMAETDEDKVNELNTYFICVKYRVMNNKTLKPRRLYLLSLYYEIC